MTGMSIDEFLSNIRYRPKKVYPDLEGTTLIEFRRRGKCTATVEYSTLPNRRKGFLVYFETLDWAELGEGEIIPLYSDRRNVVCMNYCKNRDDFLRTAKQIEENLETFYRRNS